MKEHVLRSRRALPGGERQIDGSFHLRWHSTAVMGIVNVTPDSFSDGGAFSEPSDAIRHGLELARAGALVIDVGGESTRPGSNPVPVAVELERVVPVVRELAARSSALVSIDTRKSEVARQALSAGAHLVNDVSGLSDPEMLRVCSNAGVPAVAMHMQGEPRTMQDNPEYSDVVAQVDDFLRAAASRAISAGLPDVVLDPGIGFGKRLEHNLELVRSIDRLSELGKVLVGASRKGMIAALAGESPAQLRDPGSLAVHLHAASQGAALVRVHDVFAHVQALRVWERIRG